jgi:DNA-directed RNA polymerase specialized sigma subunit
MNLIVHRLKAYKKLKAEIKSIDLEIEELHDSSNIGPSGISYDEKTGATNKFSSQTENQAITLADKVTLLEREKRSKEREIEKIDNALSILSDKERQVLEIKYINGCRWDTVTYKLDISYQRCKQIEEDAVKKILPFLNKN